MDELKTLGNVAFSAGQYVRATLRYTEALALESPPEARAVLYSNRAAALLPLSEWTLALEDCDAALRLDAANKKALFRRATANEGRGDVTAAVGDLERLLDLGPVDRPSVEARLASLRSGAAGGSSAAATSAAQSTSAGPAYASLPPVAPPIGKAAPRLRQMSEPNGRQMLSPPPGLAVPPRTGPWPQPAPVSTAMSASSRSGSIGAIGTGRPNGDLRAHAPAAATLPLPIHAVLAVPPPVPVAMPLAVPMIAPAVAAAAPSPAPVAPQRINGREPRGRGRGRGRGAEGRASNGFNRLAGQALSGIGVSVTPVPEASVPDVKGKGKERAVDVELSPPSDPVAASGDPSAPVEALVPAKVARGTRSRKIKPVAAVANGDAGPSSLGEEPSQDKIQPPQPEASLSEQPSPDTAPSVALPAQSSGKAKAKGKGKARATDAVNPVVPPIIESPVASRPSSVEAAIKLRQLFEQLRSTWSKHAEEIFDRWVCNSDDHADIYSYHPFELQRRKHFLIHEAGAYKIKAGPREVSARRLMLTS